MVKKNGGIEFLTLLYRKGVLQVDSFEDMYCCSFLSLPLLNKESFPVFIRIVFKGILISHHFIILAHVYTVTIALHHNTKKTVLQLMLTNQLP